MYCSTGVCTCLSNYVAISGYCYIKINPGENGCVDSDQCSAVWPDSFCNPTNMCQCPDLLISQKTRDGTVCVEPSLPSCPLPEGAGASAVLANPNNHPLGLPGAIVPVLCTSGSTATTDSNGGAGSSWCIYPDGNHDVYIADIYDCLTHPQVPFVFSGIDMGNGMYAATIDGICCPSRAFACSQAMEKGENPSEPRWWYNAITGTCQMFLWDPNVETAISSNNFRTVQHCESYCRDTCKRGSPQYQPSTTSLADEAPIGNCLTSTSCSTNFECTAIGSLQLCCPTIASVCGPLGGRPLATAGGDFDSGYPRPGGQTTSRYYYDAEHGRCLPFEYAGSLGNYNNFMTKLDCELFCSRLVCDYGSPLRIGEDPQRCQSNNDCPSSHNCETDQNVCCPTAQAICSQPKRLGDCTNNVRRYWYNAITRECEMFEYTGCQGNDNNFESLLACQQKCKNIVPQPNCPQGQAYKDFNGNYFVCSNTRVGNVCPKNYDCYYDGYVWGCCPTKTYTCSLQSDVGVQCGSGRSYKYFYNALTQQCESFEFAGCDGNSNNFASRTECETYCGVGGCPNGGQPYRNDKTSQVVVCSKTETCPTTHECVSVSSSGSTVNRCCPTKAHICGMPPQQGTMCGSTSVTRYYFNIVTKECTSFAFNGCAGNLNNFADMKQCNYFCLSAACDPGDIVYVNPNSNKVVECNNALQNSCPPNFNCRYDTLSTKHVCCGSTNMGVCPESEKAYVNALDMTVRECLVNIETSCPGNFLCRLNKIKNRYYCCASINGNVCPTGRALYKNSQTLNPIRCSLNDRQSTCPTGYSCQSKTKDTSYQGYCCSSTSICPFESEYLTDENTQMPRTCTPGSFITCPSGHSCQKSNSGIAEGYCCKGTILAVTDGCPPNEYVYMENKQVVDCDPFNPPNRPCPTGFSCQWSPSNQRYQCCGAEPQQEYKSNNGCPYSQIAYLNPVTDKIQVCTSSAQTCPLGYFCQFSEANTQFQCCGISADCPDKKVAFISVMGAAQTCTIGGSPCPSGFTCQRTSKGSALCCTSDISGALLNDCSSNQVSVNSVCLDRVGPSAACTNPAQCLGGSVCTAGTCQCSPGFTAVNDVCAAANPSCSSGQVLVNGVCQNKVEIGQSCQATAQCQGGATCSSQKICECMTGYAVVNNTCTSQAKKVTCPIPGQIPFVETGTVAVRFCPANTPGVCPVNYSCQFSATAEQNICCGAPVAPTNNTIEEVCPTGQVAFLLNGLPRVCTTAVCPSGFSCVYSRSAGNYYCCSPARGVSRTEPTTGTNGCLRGDALLFPSTSTPVVCSPESAKCPTGYECVENVDKSNHQCCTTSASESVLSRHSDDKEPLTDASETSTTTNTAMSSIVTTTSTASLAVTEAGRSITCPSFMVVVPYEEDGKKFERCGERLSLSSELGERRDLPVISDTYLTTRVHGSRSLLPSPRVVMRSLSALLLLIVATVHGRQCDIGDKCDQCEIKYVEGKKCVRNDGPEAFSVLLCNNATKYIEPNERAFLICDRVSKRLRQVACSTLNGVSMEFDGKSGCVEPMHRRYKRQLARSGRVGDACNFNTDCLTGMYCSTGMCACLSNYVAVTGYCYIS
uniref:BPTI/Kunitz inhibitor domain-containing protein n=1 Tax=Plectus sambesii TaxID=2011161 RepID=A0A914UKY9_9BILA